MFPSFDPKHYAYNLSVKCNVQELALFYFSIFYLETHRVTPWCGAVVYLVYVVFSSIKSFAMHRLLHRMTSMSEFFSKGEWKGECWTQMRDQYYRKS